MKGQKRGHRTTAVDNHARLERRSRWELVGVASLILLAKEPSMFRDPRAMLGLLVVCAMVAWAMVLLV